MFEMGSKHPLFFYSFHNCYTIFQIILSWVDMMF